MMINLIEIYNRYFKIYSVKKVNRVVPANTVRVAVDVYEKYIPILPLMENPVIYKSTRV